MAKALNTVAVEGNEHVQVSTYSLIGPKNLKYEADYFEAKDAEGFAEAISRNGLTVEDVNFALRQVRKQTYLDALEQTPDDLIANAVKAMLAIGVPEEQARAIAEAQRQTLGKGLPNGLRAVMKDGKHVEAKQRGRKTATPAPQTVTA